MSQALPGPGNHINNHLAVLTRRLLGTIANVETAARIAAGGFVVRRSTWMKLKTQANRPRRALGHVARRIVYRSKRKLRRMHEALGRRLVAANSYPATRPPTHDRPSIGMQLLALEPRIVFDAAAVATADQMIDDASRQQGEAGAPDARASEFAQPETTAFPDAAEGADPLAQQRHEIAFVDGSLSNVAGLIAGIDPSVEIVMLDASRDGVEQIAAALQGRQGLDAIHILSHGSEGRLNLGNAVLDAASMQGEHLDELTAIGSALSAGGDILIYGCDFTGGEAGLQAAVILGGITGADVAASTDDTGSATLGGDWHLESSVGSVETAGIFAPDYDGLLAPLTITPAGTGGVTATTIAQQLMGSNVVIHSATLFGQVNQAGIFSGATGYTPSWLAFDSGVIFSSGSAAGLPTSNTADDYSAGITSSTGGLAAFGTIGGNASHNASYIDISFTPDNDRIAIQFVFGSDEYNEYVYGAFSDAIAIWVNGTNIAVTPSGAAISIDTINGAGNFAPQFGNQANDPNPTNAVFDSAAPSLFVNNDLQNGGGAVPIEMDGFTRTLGATITVNPGVVNTIRLGVSDIGDGWLDSWLLVKADSVQANLIAQNDIVGTTLNTPVTFDVLANDIDFDGDAKNVINIADQPISTGQTLTLASGAQVTLNSDKTLTVTPAPNSTNQELFTYTISDGNGNTATAYATVNIVSGTPPTLDLDASAAGTGYAATYTVGAGGIAVADVDAIVSDSNNIARATISLGGSFAGDQLTVGTLPAGVTVDPSSTATSVVLVGNVSPATMATAIKAVTFSNASGAPDTSDRQISVQVTDATGLSSAIAQTTIEMVLPNAAPVIDLDGPLPVSDGTLPVSPPDNAWQVALYGGHFGVAGSGDATPLSETGAVGAPMLHGVGYSAAGSVTFDDTNITNIENPRDSLIASGFSYVANSANGDYVPNGTGIWTMAMSRTLTEAATITVGEPGGYFDDHAELFVNGVRVDAIIGWYPNLPAGEVISYNASAGDVVEVRLTNKGNLGGFSVSLVTAEQPNDLHHEVTYTEGDGPIPVTLDTKADAADVENGITSLAIAAGGLTDGSAEVVRVDGASFPLGLPSTQNVTVGGTTFSIGYSPAGGFSVTNAAGAGVPMAQSDLDSLIRSITYENTSQDPTAGDRTLTFVATDSGGLSSAPAVSTIHVVPVNDAPAGVSDTIPVTEDMSVTQNVLGNDTDPEIDPLIISTAAIDTDGDGTPDTLTLGTPTSITDIAGNPIGTITVAANGDVTFAPALDYTGAVPPLTYTPNDGTIDGTPATVTFGPITAVADQVAAITPPDQTTAEDTALVFSAANGNAITLVDPDGVAGGNVIVRLGVPASTGTLQLGGSAGLLSVSGNGTNEIIATGSVSAINAALNGLTFMPVADWNGAVPSDLAITMTRPTDLGFLNAGFEQPAFTGPPTANYPLEGTVPGWETSASDDRFEIWQSGFLGVPAFEGNQFAELNAFQVSTLSQTFTPSSAGGDLTLTFAHRGRSGVDTMNVTAIDLGSDGLLGGGDDTVLFSQSYADDQTAWRQYQADLGTASGNPILLQFNSLSAAGGATVGNFLDAISIYDSSLSTTASVGITVSPVADVIDDTVTTNEDTAVTFNVLTGTNGAEADNFENAGRTVTSITQPANGSVTFAANGTMTYTPDGDFNGDDTLTYTVTSPAGITETATVTVTVVPVNDAPAGVSDTIPVTEDMSVTQNVLGNDTDPEIDPLTISTAAIDTDGDGSPDPLALGIATPLVDIGGNPVGTITVAANGDVTFVPALNYTGPVPSLTYTPNDGTVDGIPATVSFGPITPVAEAPAGADTVITIDEDTTYVVTIADFGFSDPDGDAFDHVEITALPAAGALLLSGNPVSVGDEITAADIASGFLTFVPAPNANGAHYADFQFVVCDDSAASLFTETFGAGTGRASFASAGLAGSTSYVYDPTGTIQDGDYALVSEIDPSLGNWWNTTNFSAYDYSQTDHTGDPNGRFMIVNASFGAGEFYRQGVTITQGGDYQVSVALANGNSFTVKPNVTISIVDASNAVVATMDTGNLADYTAANNWQTYSLTAGLAPGNYTFVLVNNAPGGFGNDLYVDDIVFASAPPNCDPSPNTITVDVTPVNDTPVANDDTLAVTENGPAATGDVTPGTVGQDSDLDGDTLTVTGVNGAAFTPGVAVALASGALLTMNADGTYVYDPNGAYEALGVGQSTSDSFTYEISDGNGGFGTATVTISISGVNDAPVTTADTNSGTEQQTLSGNLITGTVTAGSGAGGADTDVDGGPLAVLALGIGSVGSPIVLTHGTLTVQANGSYTFVPNATANALDQSQVVLEQITYTVTDGNGGTAQATLTLSLTGQNDAPFQALAIPQTITTDGGSVSFPTFGAFHDPDGETLTYALSPSAPAWLAIDTATGVVSGTPPADASKGGLLSNGSYTFAVIATDPHGASASANATVIVTNLAPVAVDDTASVGEDTADVTGNVLTDAATGDADTAPDSDALVVASAVQGANALVIGTPFVTAGGGTLTLNSDGSYTFEPGTAYNGLDAGETATETITYTVSDGNGGFDTASLVITVVGANDAPVIVDPANPGSPSNPIPATDPLNIIPDVATTDGAALSPIQVADFVVDPDGEPLTFAIDPTTPSWISIDPLTGEITGTPPADASQGTNTGNPGEYLITITATDPDGAVVTTTVTLTIVNLAPVAQDDTASVGEDTADVTGNVLTDAATGDADTAPDSDALVVASAVQGANALVIGTPFVTAGGGTLTLNSDGSYTFEPGTAYNGLDAGETATETITYTVSDGNGGFDTASLVITVVGANDAPVSTAISAQLGNDAEPVTLDVSGNFTDPDITDVLTFTATGFPPGLAISPSGVISGTIDPSASVNGPYTVTVTAQDGSGATTLQTFVWAVTNPAPVAVDDIVTTGENTALTGDVTPGTVGQDADPDGDVMTVTEVAGVPGNVGAGVAGSNGGTFTFQPNGIYTFDPGTAFDDLAVGESRVSTVTYTISDGEGGTATATVSVTVTGVNDAPTAQDISLSTREDHPISGKISLTDIDGDELTVAGPVSGPANGVVIVNEDGTFTYQPRGGFAGQDSFVVQVGDGHGGFDLATVTISVLEESSIIPQPHGLEPIAPNAFPAAIASDRFHGIVLDTVDRLTGHPDSSIDLSVSGIVLNTVNTVHRLEGPTLELGGGRQDTGPIAKISASAALAARAEAAFPMSHGFWDVQALSGYSVRLLAGDGGADVSGRIVVDTLMRDRIIFVQVSNTLDQARHGRVESYKVLQSDGRPLPDWVSAADNGTLLVQAPIAGRTLDLRIVATLADGSTIERGILLHLPTGQVEEIETYKSPAPMFDEQVKRRRAQ